MEKYLELAKNLKALAERGVGGEAINAQKILDHYMKKYNISIDDIENEKVEERVFKVEKKHKKLVMQIISVVCGTSKVKIYIAHSPFRIFVDLTLAQMIEIEARIDFYTRLYEKELRVFFLAFLDKHGLYAPTDGKKIELTQEEIEQRERARILALGLENKHYQKQLQKGV